MYRILMAIAFMGMATAYAQEHKVIGEANNYSLVELNGKIGVWDGESYMIKPEYDKIEGDKNGVLFYAYKGTALSLYSGYEIIPIKQQLISVQPNQFDGWQLTSTEGIGYLDHEMRILPPVFDKISIEAESIFECCYNAIVEKDGKKGLYVNGIEILPVEFEKIEESEDYDFDRPVVHVTRNKKQGLFLGHIYHQPEGEMVLKPEYDEIKYVSGGIEDGHIFIVKKDKMSGLFGGNENFIMMLPPQYKSIDPKSLYHYGTWSSVSVKSEEGSHKVLFSSLEPDFKPLYFAGSNKIEDAFIIRDEAGKYGVMPPTMDSPIIPFEYEMIQPYGDFSFAVKKNGKWGIMKYNGTPLTEIIHSTIPEVDEE